MRSFVYLAILAGFPAWPNCWLWAEVTEVDRIQFSSEPEVEAQVLDLERSRKKSFNEIKCHPDFLLEPRKKLVLKWTLGLS